MKTGKKNEELLRVLADCATECDTCFDASLKNDKTDNLARVVKLCRDCAKICYATLSFVASNSNHAKHLAKECAEICKECAEACGENTDVEHECMPCMEICQACEKACREFAA